MLNTTLSSERKKALAVVLVVFLVFLFVYKYQAPSRAVQEESNKSTVPVIPDELRQKGVNPTCIEKNISLKEVNKHNVCSFRNENNDAWVAINGYVYDVSNFLLYHPGGEVICDFAGKDATETFMSIHHQHVISESLPEMCIGKLVG